jgi:hypothetical protein
VVKSYQEQIRREAVSKYQCRFIDESEQAVVRLMLLRSTDGYNARREIVSLIGKTKDFDGYQLWEDGRMVDAYRPAKSRGTL